MTLFSHRLLPCLAVIGGTILLAAAPPQSTDAEVEHLIKQLGSDVFQERETATTRLKEIGEPALDALQEATTSKDLEVRLRAEQVVAVIKDKIYGEQLRLTDHTGPVHRVCVSADGKRVLTSSEDKTLRLWDAVTGKQLLILEGHTDCITAAALSADGKQVLSGSHDETVRLWDATTGKEIHKMTGPKMGVLCVAFGPKGQALSGSFDKRLYLWNLNTGRSAGVFTGHTCWLVSVAYSDTARLAATCSMDTDRSIRLWDLETGQEVRKMTENGSINGSICFSPDGKRLLSAGTETGLCIWDVQTGKELKRIKENAYHAAFSPDGQRIVSASYYDHCVRVWDALSGKELRKYEGHTDSVLDVVFFPGGKRIASASLDGTARIWRAPR